MNITLSKHGPADRLLTITLSEQDYSPKVTQKLKDYSRRAHINGFRKGKAPYGMIQKMYGESLLADEVNALVGQSLNQYIKDQGLRLVGNPLLSQPQGDTVDWSSQKNFTFEFRLGLVNPFTYKLSEKVKLKTYPIEINDKVVYETITNLRKRFGRVMTVEEAGSEDYLQGELISLKTEKTQPVRLRIESVREKVRKKLIGKKTGDEATFDINDLFDDKEDKAQLLTLPRAEADTVKGDHRLKIESISRVEAAELNQELFDRILGQGSVDSEATFRDKVREQVTLQYKGETDRLLDEYIRQHFIENTKLDLPEKFLAALLERQERPLSKDEIKWALERQKNQLKWDLIANQIAKDLSIQVAAEEVTGRARAFIMAQYGNLFADPALTDKLDAITQNYLADRDGENFQRIEAQMRQERVLGTIKKIITLTEKPVSLEKFRELARELQY